MDVTPAQYAPSGEPHWTTRSMVDAARGESAETTGAGATPLALVRTAARSAAGAPTAQGTSFAQWQTPQLTRAYTSKLSARDANTPGFPGIDNEAGPWTVD